MGFLGLSNILKFDNYFGKNEFNDNSLYDGFWGIWDEPFLQYVNNTTSKLKNLSFPLFLVYHHMSHFMSLKNMKEFFQWVMFKCIK